MTKQILLIDGDQDHSQALKTFIERLQYDITVANTTAEVKDCLTRSDWDVFLADPFIDEDLQPMLLSAKKKSPRVQLIILAPRDKLDEAMDLFGAEAIQYLEIPVNSKALEIGLILAARNLAQTHRMSRYTSRLADLHNAQDLLNQLFEEVPCYISVQDRNLRITAANKRFKHHFSSRIGEFCYEIYKHRTSPCPECPVQETFHDGKVHSTEEIVTSKFGKQYNVLTQTAPIRNEMGEITQVMEMSTNITQIRQLQDHLVSLGLMLGSMSHGVKGMLTALDGGIYQLETGLAQKDEARVARAFEQIRQMADKIKKMVLEILYYAKSRELRYETIEVAILAKNVLSTITPMAERYAIALDVSVCENLGTMEVDHNWMEAALVNFLENALDACVVDRTQKDHHVGFSVEQVMDGWIDFTVTDNGIGMDTETRNKMFTLFFTSKGSRGTGLGMFIAHRVIKYHGGSVTVMSEPGKGSRFHVRLPVRKPDSARLTEFPKTDR